MIVEFPVSQSCDLQKENGEDVGLFIMTMFSLPTLMLQCDIEYSCQKKTLIYYYSKSKSSNLSLYLATVLRTLELSTHVTKSSRLREIKNAGSVTT